MKIGEAIEALKQGKKVARNGWNGKGLFVFMQVPARIPLSVIPNMQSLPQAVKDTFVERGLDSIHYMNQFAIVYPDNTIMGYAPSGSDTLGEDWEIVN